MPPCPATAYWWQTQAPGHLSAEVVVGCILCGIFFFSFQLCCPLRFQNSPQTRLWEASYCVETFPPSRLRPQDRSPSLTLLSLFLSFIFVLPPFEENGLTFWVPGILHQRSEIVLWKLLSIQMMFWWTFLMNLWGRKWSPILFLHHLWIALLFNSSYSVPWMSICLAWLIALLTLSILLLIFIYQFFQVL